MLNTLPGIKYFLTNMLKQILFCKDGDFIEKKELL